MKTLVTGGGGFLGTHIVQKLLARGDEVIVLGRNVYPNLQSWGAKCVVGDIREYSSFAHEFKDVEEVYHTAAIAGYGDNTRTILTLTTLEL